MTKVNRVIGIETKIQKMSNVNGQACYLPCVSYRLLTTDLGFFSPHTYHHMHGGSSEVFCDQLIIKFLNHIIEIPINVQGINLPIIENSWLAAKYKDLYGPQIISALLCTSFYSLYFLWDLYTHKKTHYLPIEKEVGYAYI